MFFFGTVGDTSVCRASNWKSGDGEATTHPALAALKDSMRIHSENIPQAPSRCLTAHYVVAFSAVGLLRSNSGNKFPIKSEREPV